MIILSMNLSCNKFFNVKLIFFMNKTKGQHDDEDDEEDESDDDE